MIIRLILINISWPVIIANTSTRKLMVAVLAVAERNSLTA